MDDSAEILFKKGLADFKAYRTHAAVLHLARALAVAAKPPGLELAYLKALRRDARFQEALAFSPEQGIDGAELHYERAMCLLALGETQPALDAFDQALAHRPDMAVAWYHSHAPLLSLKGREPAMQRIERALACQGPVNGNYVALLAAYHWLQGQKDEAKRLARKGRHRVLVEGLAALEPHFAGKPALFAVSAELLRHALAGASQPGLVLEFGVRRGTSLRILAVSAGQEVHGFDSFEGLPEAWRGGTPGLLTTGRELPGLPANATLHPGWFEDTLPAFLRAHPGDVRFVNIDSDIYASAKTVLTLLAPRLVAGSVVVFDELIGNPSWREDEYKALTEFARDYGARFEIFALSPASKQAALRVVQPPALAKSQ